MRRILLSSIEGAAITAVKIDGVLHEFSSVPGVVEDTTDIILNLKQVPFRSPQRSSRDADHLRPRGRARSPPGDIKSVPTWRSSIPSAVATLSEEGKISTMEMRLKRGRGYVSADRNFDDDLGIGYIPLDSVHSPVRKVNYSGRGRPAGADHRLRQADLEVWTNGAVKPQDAVASAAKLLKDHMAIFINFEETPEEELDFPTTEDERLLEQLSRSVDELELSVRSYNCLKNADIKRSAIW